MPSVFMLSGADLDHMSRRVRLHYTAWIIKVASAFSEERHDAVYALTSMTGAFFILSFTDMIDLRCVLMLPWLCVFSLHGTCLYLSRVCWALLEPRSAADDVECFNQTAQSTVLTEPGKYRFQTMWTKRAGWILKKIQWGAHIILTCSFFMC